MRVEAPQFKRCLCCLPLRYGLLAIGYLKLLTGVLLAPFLTMELIRPRDHYGPVWFLLFKCFTILLIVGDTALAVVFVISCHKKDVKLLKIYNYYSIGFCVASTLLWIATFAFWLNMIIRYTGVLFGMYALRFIIVLGVLNTCFHVYLIFLTRSEILKLENSIQFSFSNNANEAECAMVNETGNNVKNAENEDINSTEHTLVNDDDVKEYPEISVNDNDEMKGEN